MGSFLGFWRDIKSEPSKVMENTDFVVAEHKTFQRTCMGGDLVDLQEIIPASGRSRTQMHCLRGNGRLQV